MAPSVSIKVVEGGKEIPKTKYHKLDHQPSDKVSDWWRFLVFFTAFLAVGAIAVAIVGYNVGSGSDDDDDGGDDGNGKKDCRINNPKISNAGYDSVLTKVELNLTKYP